MRSVEQTQLVILHNNNFMFKPPQFIVRNTKSTPQTGYQTRRQSFSGTKRMLVTGQLFGSEEESMTPEQRVNRLMGNLKMLEKRYRENLKEGFEHKIKAYRLQAVVDRKMIQQAVQMTAKDQEMERLQQKIEFKERMRRVSQERALLSSYQRQERQQYIKQRNESQKRKMCLTLYQRNKSIEIQQKKVHDQIVWQQLNSDRKKVFFQEIRRLTQKRELFQTKRQLLGRVMTNTKKLKQLKMALRSLEEGTLEEGTFLTL